MILRKASKTQKTIAATIAIFIFLVIWQIGTTGTTLGKIIPTPIEVIVGFFTAFVKPIGKNTLLIHFLATLSRFFVGYALAIASGCVLGLLMGWYKRVEAFFRPLFELIRPVPTLAWIPIGIIWFGLGESTKYFLVFIGAFMSITQNAYAGAKSVDKTIVNAAKMLGASDLKLFFTIVIPSSIPMIFAGLHTGLAAGWASVVAAEMVRSSNGIGWIIVMGQVQNNMTQILIGIISIAIIGFGLAIIMRKIEDRLCIWNKRGR